MQYKILQKEKANDLTKHLLRRYYIAILTLNRISECML